MKCAYKILGAVGFALGLMISTLYITGLSIADKGNWEVLAWGFIGFAIGALVAKIVGKVCGAKSCDS